MLPPTMPILHTQPSIHSVMKKVSLIFMAITVMACNSDSQSSTIARQFLEEFYQTDISIVSAQRDSIYNPLPAYQSILDRYDSLAENDVEKEALLYREFQESETGDPNAVGIKVRYKRSDKRGDVFDDIFYLNGDEIEAWGLNASLRALMITTKHNDFIKAHDNK